MKKKHLKKKQNEQKRALAALEAIEARASKPKKRQKLGSKPGHGPSTPQNAGPSSPGLPPGTAAGTSGSDSKAAGPSPGPDRGQVTPEAKITKSMLPKPRSRKMSEEEFLRQKKLRKKLRAGMKRQQAAEQAARLAENPPPPKVKREKRWRKNERERLALKAGDAFPDLGEFPTDEWTPDEPKMVDLSELLKEQGVVLFVHVRADASGCTKQALEFERERLTYEGRGFRVFGLSPSHPKKTEYWKRKRKLTLSFLSDPYRLRLKKLGVTMGAKGVQRSVFVIDKGGVIKFAKIKVNPQLSQRMALNAVRAKVIPQKVPEPLVAVQ